MVNQTKLNNQSPSGANVDEPLPSARSLAQHVLELSSLQWRLLRADFKSAAEHLQWGLLLVVSASIGLLAALPVFLLAVAEFLQHATNLSQAASLLLVALVASLTCSLVIFTGWRRLWKAGSNFKRSADEFQNNLEWLQQSFAQKDEQTPPSMRPR